MVTVSCGKKGDPFLPQKEISARVTDLQGKREEGKFLLRGKVLGPKEVEGARVYYAQYPLEKGPCEGCPIEYQGHHAFGPEVVTGEGFLCTVPIRVPGQIYFFRVNLIGPGGEMGPPSETVKLVVK